jgi:hypothetical protein
MFSSLSSEVLYFVRSKWFQNILSKAEPVTDINVPVRQASLATLRHVYLGSFFLDPENVRDLSLRAFWNFFRRTGLLWLGSNEGAQGACEGLRATGQWGLDPNLLILIRQARKYVSSVTIFILDCAYYSVLNQIKLQTLYSVDRDVKVIKGE